MKNLKYMYRLLLILPLVFMTACDGSDDIQDVFSNTTTMQENSVFIETDAMREEAVITGTDIPQTITVGINNAVNADVTVSFTVTKDGAAAVEGTDYDMADAIIATDANFSSSDITFYEIGKYEIKIASASESTLEVAENRLLFVVPPPVTFALSWADSFYDYDIFLFDGIENGFSDLYSNGLPAGLNLLGFSNDAFTNFEYFEAVPGTGSSYLYFEDYWGDNASIDTVLIVNDGEDHIFDIVMDMDKWGLRIDATIGDDGFPEYTFTQL